ncbi:DUF2256 domain-containing protein [Thermaurantiacus sp.]
MAASSHASVAASWQMRHVPPVPRRVQKADRPAKTCAHCGRPFTWRKKWSRTWDEVRYCSKACRRRTPALARKETG